MLVLKTSHDRSIGHKSREHRFPEVYRPHPPKKKRPRRKHVTIAAGFNFDGGLLLCADTKITTDAKTNESKLFYRDYANGQCATAFTVAAEDLEFAINAINSCQASIEQLDFADSQTDFEALRKALESALRTFYEEHLFPRPPESESADFDLLIGIWLRGHTRLFASRYTVVNPVDEPFRCIGTGGYLAKFLLRKFLAANSEPLTVEDAAMIASYALKNVTEFDDTTGGDPELLIMKDSGEIEETCDSVIYPGAGLHEQMQTATLRLMHELAHVGPSDMQAETEILFDEFCAKVREISKSCGWWFETRAKVRRSQEP